MMKKHLLAILSVALCLIVMGCSTDNLTRESDEEADISIENGVFAVTMDECIKILNEDVQKENLPLIPTKYDTETENVVLIKDGEESMTVEEGEGETYTVYSAKITDTIELQMRAFKRLEGGLPVIEIVNTPGKSTQKEDAVLTKQYFKIICNNVEPKFNVDEFNISFVSNKHYELGELYFWCGQLNGGKGDGNKILRYYVTTNSDLFSYYMTDPD